MAIAFVQVKGTSQGAGGTSIAAAFTTNNVAGNAIIVVALWLFAGNHTATIADSLGNTYSTAVAKYGNGDANSFSQIWFASNIASGANTVTVTFSGNNAESYLIVSEYSGLATAGMFDVQSSNQAAGTALDSLSATTTQADELIFGAGGNEVSVVTITPGTNFTLRLQQGQLFSEDRIVTAIASYNATATQDNTNFWQMAMATFKGAVAAPGGPPKGSLMLAGAGL